jgi:hypothetical protein
MLVIWIHRCLCQLIFYEISQPPHLTNPFNFNSDMHNNFIQLILVFISNIRCILQDQISLKPGYGTGTYILLPVITKIGGISDCSLCTGNPLPVADEALEKWSARVFKGLTFNGHSLTNQIFLRVSIRYLTTFHLDLR